jgi:hypothetical protein
LPDAVERLCALSCSGEQETPLRLRDRTAELLYRGKVQLPQLLARPREVSSLWHSEQAKALIESAKITKSATVLVYAALEARLSVERCIFEAGLLIRGDSFSADELRKALGKRGLNTFLTKLVGDWRRYFEFSAEVATLNGLQFPGEVVPRCDLFQQLITRLSGYCHWIADPATTIEDPTEAWFSKGVSFVEDALTQVSNTPQCALTINSHQPEVQALWESYRDDQVDRDGVRTQLRLMQPVLESRLRQK